MGVEIPLLVRLLARGARAEGADRACAVVGLRRRAGRRAACFRSLLVPRLGLARSALAFGIVNAAGRAVERLAVHARGSAGRTSGCSVQSRRRDSVVLAVFFAQRGVACRRSPSSEIYAGEILHAQTTRRTSASIVTRLPASSFQLFLSGALQFNSEDEYRYHESLVHPAMAVARRAAARADPRRRRRAGRAARCCGIRVGRARRAGRPRPGRDRTSRERSRPLVELNGDALADPARRGRQRRRDELARGGGTDLFDVAIVDFPDPYSFSVGKLYTDTFYTRLLARPARAGRRVRRPEHEPASRAEQLLVHRGARSSPLGLFVRPYHAAVPSFGEWGFMLAASQRSFDVPSGGARTICGTFRTPSSSRRCSSSPRTPKRREVEVNRLSTQSLVRYYDDELQLMRRGADASRRARGISPSRTLAWLARGLWAHPGEGAAAGGASDRPVTLRRRRRVRVGHAFRDGGAAAVVGPLIGTLRSVASSMVGGGVAGLSAAWRLAAGRASTTIVLLDLGRDSPAWHRRAAARSRSRRCGR